MTKAVFGFLFAFSLSSGVFAGTQAAAEPNGDAERGAALFRERCASCHISEGKGGRGPNLTGVLGRKAASTGFSYSPALKASSWTWDEANLDRYLTDPAAALPGVSMQVSVPDPKDRSDLIAYLGALRGPALPSPEAQSAKGAAPGRGGEPSPAFGDWRTDKPGLRHRITLADLPPPYATRFATNGPRVVARPARARPQAPAGFRAELFAEGLIEPRIMRVAANGDLFVAETGGDRVRVLRPSRDGKAPAANEVFASKLDGPFGIAFYPQGDKPQWVYVAENNRVVRFAYTPGDLKARAAPEVIVPKLAPSSGGHSTRDIAFSKDGARMFVSVGSSSNVAEGMARKTPNEIRRWEAENGLGAAWGAEEHRADVLVFTPEGKEGRVYATGLRNCVGLAVHPETGELYCSTNERDGLGDNLPPDYVTRVKEGAFYGWPWRYMGDHEDPRWKGARPDLAGKAAEPDVLLQPHCASLGMTFYDGSAFPPDYKGSAFAAFHGSWNRAVRTGYKVVRVIVRDGAPTGEYEDFLTGFVIDNNRVWGRPVGVAVGKDGSLFVSEDGNGSIWRVTFEGQAAGR